VKVVGWIADPATAESLTTAAGLIEAELVSLGGSPSRPDRQRLLLDSLRAHPDLVVVEYEDVGRLAELREETRLRGIALVVLCRSEVEAVAAARAEADECVLHPIEPARLAVHLRIAEVRSERRRYVPGTSRAADHFRYEELLYDRSTGFPTLPVMMERGREMLERFGRLTVLYLQFVRYAKLEEVFGWEKLDQVLRTSANAVREFVEQKSGGTENALMVSHVADEDFIFFTSFRGDPREPDAELNEIAARFEKVLHDRVEEVHGEEIATLLSIYVGASTIFRDPKIRTERIIYRGIREAAEAASGYEARERRRRITDLKTTLRTGAIRIEYQPIVITATGETYGYEALARGALDDLRSPELLFDIAQDANLVWELSRLCRRRAIEGAAAVLGPGEFLFLNIDPHDFRDPSFHFLDTEEISVPGPERIVLEITERIAITDYVAFQKYIRNFRTQGYRIAVDDAGSGYAGLGSIANLEPDFIKLDISLISGIDGNFMKQNLVETMVEFAEDHSIQVIAEGVERDEEYEVVKRLGVHLAQGFLFHRPEDGGRPSQAGER